ncbi:MAG: DUF190 domain-containing protein [Gemmatimonadetes bacterium]|nr:DUF190 domain-containing protein [Gemmatimonadota bacterium]
MILPREGFLLRIYIGEGDRHENRPLPLFEWLVRRVREHGLAGATVLLLSYGAWKTVDGLIMAELPWTIKAAIFAVLVGFIILLVSVIREKLFTHRRNPYKDIVQ